MYRCHYYAQGCYHTENAGSYASSLDPEGPQADDLAYDAMTDHLMEVHGVPANEVSYLVHQGRRSAVA